MWKSSRQLEMDLPPPELHGWVKNCDKLEPIMCLEPAAPAAMIELVKCGCTTGCLEESTRCGCRKNNLSCTDACACMDCENEPTEKLANVFDLESDSEDDSD